MNFTIYEFIKSDTAKLYKIDNTPNMDVCNNIMRLVVDVLQPFRDYLGKPINITSGYRCDKVNSLVGGSSNSQHLSGCAVDIVVPSLTPRQLKDKFISSGLPFDQIVVEPSWLHLSYEINRNRKEIIYNEKKKS